MVARFRRYSSNICFQHAACRLAVSVTTPSRSSRTASYLSRVITYRQSDSPMVIHLDQTDGRRDDEHPVIGIDISQPSLDVARGNLSSLRCPVDLRCQDFVEAIADWDESVDVIWISQSLHHLRADAKKDFMRRVRALLPRNGIFLIWEPTCLEGEDREGWMERFRRLRPEWSAITDDEFAAFDTHHRSSDYAETATAWMAMGREAGFQRVEELLLVPNKLARVYRYGS